MDVTDDKLPNMVCGLFNVEYTTTTLWRHVQGVLTFVHGVPPLDRWNERLNDTDLGNVTFILDGTVEELVIKNKSVTSCLRCKKMARFNKVIGQD